MKEDAIAGGPGWVASDLFDIISKVPEGTNMAEANQMLQSLLADRFKLVVKQETHPVPRYVVTVGKGAEAEADEWIGTRLPAGAAAGWGPGEQFGVYAEHHGRVL